MLKYYVGFSVLLTGVLLDLFDFQQDDYQLVPERLEVLRYDKRFIKYGSLRTFKYNRTTPVTNGSCFLNVDFGNEFEIIVQAYKFMSNEYRLFPVHFEINLCLAFEKNVMGVQSIKKCGNFNGCPLVKNKRYYVCNWTPDQSKFPPLIPNGKYMLELQGLFHDQEIGVVRAYGEVTRALVKK